MTGVGKPGKKGPNLLLRKIHFLDTQVLATTTIHQELYSLPILNKDLLIAYFAVSGSEFAGLSYIYDFHESVIDKNLWSEIQADLSWSGRDLKNIGFFSREGIKIFYIAYYGDHLPFPDKSLIDAHQARIRAMQNTQHTEFDAHIPTMTFFR